MVVFILEKAPPSLRGELSRWMIEPKAGVFTGRISAAVRDLLWEEVVKKVKKGSALMIYSYNNEQGMSVRTHNDSSRQIIYQEGLFLVRMP